MPHFITCNAFIGRAYAKALAGFLRDSVQPGAVTPLDPTQPLYVVGLGAGSGKFGFFMLRALHVAGVPRECESDRPCARRSHRIWVRGVVLRTCHACVM
mgnify:CR=1 FL=1